MTAADFIRHMENQFPGGGFHEASSRNRDLPEISWYE